MNVSTGIVMNDDVKVVNQNVPPTALTSPVQPQAVTAPTQPAAPVGSANKETGPVVAQMSEFMKPTDVEPRISQDLKELGIEAKKDAPNVAAEHKGIIEHAKQFTPVSSAPTGKVVMPMSEEEITDILKTGQNDDSGKWLAGLLKKVVAVMGL